MTSTEETLNYESTKESYKIYKKAIRQTMLAFFRNTPRDEIIKVLKDLKIIKYEYIEKTDKLELVEKYGEK